MFRCKKRVHFIRQLHQHIIKIYLCRCQFNILFSNQGQTISPEEQQRIFDKFYRRDEARQTNSGGAGLGLAIAKELVDLHGGTIRVMSENGRTTFKVCLPRRKMPTA